MRYALVLSYDERNHAHSHDEETAEAFDEFFRAAGERLQQTLRLLRSSEALTIRTGDTGLVIEDGPYAETKEQVGGLLVVDCEGLDDAIDLARQVPVARIGTVEIRPIWDSWTT